MIDELQTRYGTMFVPDTDQGQYYWLKNTGLSPENEFIETICRLLEERPKGMAYDVGANFGCWTLPLEKHATHVHAFEPQRAVFCLLRRTLVANGFAGKVTAYHAAVGDSVGSASIPALDIQTSGNFGGVSLNRPYDTEPNAPMVAVEQTMIDSFFNPAKPVSFIKADVEGSEAAVLRGAVETIRYWKPILFVECDHKLTDADALRSQIADMGYVVDKRGGNYLGMPA